MTGDLASKKATSDQATQAVYKDHKANGFAPLGLVTDARTKLIEYGQPALEYLRNNTTPALSDSFHAFLLALYDSLEQSSKPAKPAAR